MQMTLGGCIKTRKTTTLQERWVRYSHLGINNTLKYFVWDHPKDKRRERASSPILMILIKFIFNFYYIFFYIFNCAVIMIERDQMACLYWIICKFYGKVLLVPIRLNVLSECGFYLKWSLKYVDNGLILCDL